MLEKSLFILVFLLLFMGLAVWSGHVKTSSDTAFAASAPAVCTFNGVDSNKILELNSTPHRSGPHSGTHSSALPLEIEAIQSSASQ